MLCAVLCNYNVARKTESAAPISQSHLNTQIHYTNWTQHNSVPAQSCFTIISLENLLCNDSSTINKFHSTVLTNRKEISPGSQLGLLSILEEFGTEVFSRKTFSNYVCNSSAKCEQTKFKIYLEVCWDYIWQNRNCADTLFVSTTKINSLQAYWSMLDYAPYISTERINLLIYLFVCCPAALFICCTAALTLQSCSYEICTAAQLH